MNWKLMWVLPGPVIRHFCPTWGSTTSSLGGGTETPDDQGWFEPLIWKKLFEISSGWIWAAGWKHLFLLKSCLIGHVSAEWPPQTAAVCHYNLAVIVDRGHWYPEGWRLTFATPALSLAAFCFLLPEIKKAKNLQTKQVVFGKALTFHMSLPWR